ncbi:MAG: hypothetical protein Q9190_006947, partial [Brigantiaea leucoxantha]
MLQLPSFPGLPTSLLLLIASAPLSTLSIDAQWPYNLAPHVKYFPGDEPIIKRNVEIQERLQYQSPIALRKMDSDEGKMFFLEYWQFDTTHQIESRPVPSSMPGGGQAESEGALEAWTNASMEHPFQAPLARHFDPDEPERFVRLYQTMEQETLRAVLKARLARDKSQTAPAVIRVVQGMPEEDAACQATPAWGLLA